MAGSLTERLRLAWPRSRTALAVPEWYRCRQLLAAGRLDEAIRATGKPRLLRWMPQVAVMRARAAVELERFEIVTETAEIVAPLPMPPDARFDIARSLARLGRGEEAYTVLIADPSVRSAAAFGHTAMTVLHVTSNREKRAELQALIDTATGGGRDRRAEASDIPFAVRTEVRPTPSPMGKIDLVPATNLPPRHIDRLREDERKSRRRLEKAEPGSLQEYRDVFVDGFGQIWTEDGAILRTYGEPIPKVKRAAVPRVETACHVLSRTIGIYHWLIDRVPTLAWTLRADAPTAAIPMADDAPGFERQTLALAGLDDRIVPIADAVFVDRLIIGRVGFSGLRYWDDVAPIIDRIREQAIARARQEGVALPERIYISRRDASRRRMVNEAEVEALARERGFEPVLMSKIPLWHQIALASSCQAVLAPHGAGLAHTLFVPQTASVQEIMPITDASYALRFNYARLAMVRGVNYRAFVDIQPAAAPEWSVDLPGFEAFLKAGPTG